MVVNKLNFDYSFEIYSSIFIIIKNSKIKIAKYFDAEKSFYYNIRYKFIPVINNAITDIWHLNSLIKKIIK